MSDAALVDTYPAPAHGWTCFHCGEHFPSTMKGQRDARLHFGETPACDPACRIDIRAFRVMEERDRRHCAEDTELHRALHAKSGEMAVAVRRAEEEGYARGLADAKKHPETLGLIRALDMPPELDSRYPNDVMNEADPDECAECLAHPTGECNEHVGDGVTL